MSASVRIALIGDYNPEVAAHVAIPKALAIAGRELDCRVEASWVATDTLSIGIDARLDGFDGLWCAPASPYKSMEGALAAIRFARETGLPFLGTCGGYQHAILEYARNVLGYHDAASAEVDAGAAMPLIAPLACALVEKNSDIFFLPETRIRAIYGFEKAEESYHCSYGFNPRYAALFDKSEMVVSGVDGGREPRAIELSTHRFFIGTAFQPERSALQGESHPLIIEFVRAAQVEGKREGREAATIPNPRT
jgi:CTP synthase (UTP-ammonia lyase)